MVDGRHILTGLELTRAAFGVMKTLGMLPGRATYVVDGEGIIRHACHDLNRSIPMAASSLSSTEFWLATKV